MSSHLQSSAVERPAAVLLFPRPIGLNLAKFLTFLDFHGAVLRTIALPLGFSRRTANVTPSMNVFLEDSDLAKVHPV